jgi:hypothetical protein
MDSKLLKTLAAKYVWWKPVGEAVQMPERIVAQVMNIGDYDDVQELVKQTGEDYFRNVLTLAEAGQFNGRSWAYWHYRLGMARSGTVPPMPQRIFC